jgi:hypothetical protein
MTTATADESSDGELPNSSNIWGMSHPILERNDSCASIEFTDGSDEQRDHDVSAQARPFFAMIHAREVVH